MLARLGLQFAVPPEKKATAIWPPSGLALAALYLFGKRLWPGVWLGAFLANFADYVLGANPASAVANALVSAGIATGSTLQALLASAWLRRSNGDQPLNTVRHTFRFLVLIPAACVVAASFGTLSLLLGGFVPAAALPNLWGTWWLGDSTGILVVGSLLLSWWKHVGTEVSTLKVHRVLPLILALLLPASAAFGVLDEMTLPPPIAYLVLPLLIWSTFAFGLRGATSSLGLVSLLAVAGAAAGRGPFVQPTVLGSLALLQVYVAVIGATVLLMSAVLAENARAQNALQDYNLSLADDVARSSEALRIQEQHLHGAFQFAPIGQALVSPQGKFLQVNASLCDLVGYSEAELLQCDFQTVTHPEDLNADLELLNQVLDGRRNRYEMEKRYLHKDGHVINVFLAVSLVRDSRQAPLYFISQIKNITERKRAEAALQSALREKELMLKEIHHRVKNNLQVVSSLLELQAASHADSEVRRVFAESRARVRSMALIHERLYRSENLDRVDFESYVRGLLGYLCQTYRVQGDAVDIDIRVGWHSLPLDQAVPCGLLLNELISNSFKHAFSPPPEGARLEIELSSNGNRQLRVRDNGPGLPPNYDPQQAESFGMQLVVTLVEQLRGHMTLGGGPGFDFMVTFPD